MLLPPLGDDFEVSQAKIASYQGDGHVLLEGVASAAEISAYRPLIVQAVETYKRRMKQGAGDMQKPAFIQLLNLWRDIEPMRRFTLARRFAKIAAELMGVDAVRLYQDIVFFKEPGGKFTAWHQDNTYSPLDTDHTITMWMPLVDASVEMGTLNFATGSHRKGALAGLEISDESEEYYEKLIKELGFQVASNDMKAGDATFHSGWTLHHAGPNGTDRTREAMVIIYYEDGARIAPPDNPNKESDMKYFPGCKPGDYAVSELNPLLFRR